MRRWTQSVSPLMIALLCGLAVAACSASTSSTDVEEPGGEPVDEGGLGSGGQVEPEPEPEPEPVAAGPGQIKVLIKIGSKRAKGAVRILTADVDPTVVEEGPATQVFDVPAGRYDVEVTCHDTLDRPEKRLRDVQINPGETVEREVPFVVGNITLQPVRGRRKVGTKVRWRYTGGDEWFEKGSNAGEEVLLSAGRYDAEVLVGRTKITIRDIQVYEGRRTVYPEVSMRGR